MADSTIDTLLGGLGTVGQAALAVPQAIGSGALDALIGSDRTNMSVGEQVGRAALAIPQAIGGTALDVLIGDRTNVPVGEQIKRSIAALILAGDNPANLIAVHNMYAKQDAANQTIVGSPDFQNAMTVNQVRHDLSPMDAFRVTAKQYGVTGYTPDTTQEPHAVDAPSQAALPSPSLGTPQRVAVDAPSFGGLPSPSLGTPQIVPVDAPSQGTLPSPSLGTPQMVTVPILPPPASTDLAKNIEARTKIGAYTMGSPEDIAAARFKGAGIDPPLWLQKMRGEQAIGDQTPGAGTRNLSWNGTELTMGYRELKPSEKAFAPGHEVEALDAANTANVTAQHLGSSARFMVLKDPDGTMTVAKTDSLSGKYDTPGTGGPTVGGTGTVAAPGGSGGTVSASAGPSTPAAAPGSTITAPRLPITPDMSPAEMELVGEAGRKNMDLQYQQAVKEMEARLKGGTYSPDDLKRLNQIATARAFLNVFEDYATNGTAKETSIPASERFASSLPTERLTGPDVVVERARQNQFFQDNWQRDPFLRQFRTSYQGLAKPILTRAIGGDVGNLSAQEQEAVAGAMDAISLPEVKDTVRQLRNIITSREQEVTKGKSASGVAPTAAATARPIITRPPASTGAPTAPQASTGDPDLDAVLRRGR